MFFLSKSFEARGKLYQLKFFQTQNLLYIFYNYFVNLNLIEITILTLQIAPIEVLKNAEITKVVLLNIKSFSKNEWIVCDLVT